MRHPEHFRFLEQSAGPGGVKGRSVLIIRVGQAFSRPLFLFLS